MPRVTSVPGEQGYGRSQSEKGTRGTTDPHLREAMLMRVVMQGRTTVWEKLSVKRVMWVVLSQTRPEGKG